MSCPPTGFKMEKAVSGWKQRTVVAAVGVAPYVGHEAAWSSKTHLRYLRVPLWSCWIFVALNLTAVVVVVLLHHCVDVAWSPSTCTEQWVVSVWKRRGYAWLETTPRLHPPLGIGGLLPSLGSGNLAVGRVTCTQVLSRPLPTTYLHLSCSATCH